MTPFWRDPQLINALQYVVLVALVYLIVQLIRRGLLPTFGRFEFAAEEEEVTRVVRDWQEAKSIGRVSLSVLADFVFLVVYVYAAFQLARISAPLADRLHTAWLHVAAVALVVIAALANVIENVTMLWALANRRGSGLVWFTLSSAWTKYALLSLVIVYVIFNFEVYLLTFVETRVWWLAALMVLAGLLFARKATKLSRDKPPLLMLQLAPDRVAAKDVLERWGDGGLSLAAAALWLDSLFAILYGFTLAAFCRRVDMLYAPRLEAVIHAAAWVILAGASCHLAQNVGALIAVKMRTIGWWATPMRLYGRARLAIMVAMAAFFGALLVRLEYKLLIEPLIPQEFVTSLRAVLTSFHL